MDRYLARRADVVDLAVRLLAPHQPDKRADHVLDVAEAAPLGAVAVDRYVLVGERLAHERRDHHPVAPRLARPDRVEEARDDGGLLALLPVGEREELVEHLRAGVRPAADRG